jgi:serine/threonine protein kinase
MNQSRTVLPEEIQAALGPFNEIEPIGARSGSGECWRVKVNGETQLIKVLVHEPEPWRFEQEVAALNRLHSPRVMRVFGWGRLKVAAGSFPYLQSEFVFGGNLREHLQGRSPTDSELRSFLLELLRGLVELAESHIVHRDLKPENIILRNRDWSHPAIIDLGLCRLADEATRTIYPWARGTWPYMSPEQLRFERATHLSDIWASAVIATEVAAGAHPWWKGEQWPPQDWDQRLRGGLSVPGSRPAALRDWVAHAGDYRAYRRPTAMRSVEMLEGSW